MATKQNLIEFLQTKSKDLDENIMKVDNHFTKIIKLMLERSGISVKNLDAHHVFKQQQHILLSQNKQSAKRKKLEKFSSMNQTQGVDVSSSPGSRNIYGTPSRNTVARTGTNKFANDAIDEFPAPSTLIGSALTTQEFANVAKMLEYALPMSKKVAQEQKPMSAGLDGN